MRTAKDEFESLSLRMGLAMLAGGCKISGVLHGSDGRDRKVEIYGVRAAIERVSRNDIDSIEKNGPKNDGDVSGDGEIECGQYTSKDKGNAVFKKLSKLK